MLTTEIQSIYTVKNLSSKCKINKPNNITFGTDCFMKRQKHVHCPYCDRIMFNEKEIKQFANNIKTLKGDEALQEIITTTKQLTPKTMQKKVVAILVEEVKDNPDLTVIEIFNNLVRKNEERLLEKQVEVFKSIYQKAEKLPQDLGREIKDITPTPYKETLLNMESRQKQKLLSKKSLIYHYISIKKSLDDKDLKYNENINSIIHEAQRIPIAKESTDAYITKYGNRGYENFISNIMLPLQSTSDHIYTNETVGNIGGWNYIACCHDCNKKRMNTPIKDWVKSCDKFSEGFANYIKDYNSAINLRYSDEREIIIKLQKKTIKTFINAMLGKELKDKNGNIIKKTKKTS